MKDTCESVDQGRRRLLRLAAVALAAIGTAPVAAAEARASSSRGHGLRYAHGGHVPPVGMGTWLTFDVATDSAAFEARRNVLDTFFAYGGGMIDSSPMYGQAEKAVGELLTGNAAAEKRLFSATKIWSVVTSRGPAQLGNSFELWKRKPLDLVYVHNLLRWKEHLKTLRQAKDDGDVRLIGLTTSHGRRHDELEKLIQTEALDCVQFTYNILDREAERRLLPAASHNGVAVVINRPFRTGALFRQLAHHPLPPWADEIGCTNWAAFFLRFIISHPAVTAVIPATTRADHMEQNMLAGQGPALSDRQRQRMINYVESL